MKVKINFFLVFVISALMIGSLFAGDKYTLDKAHSSAEFSVSHLVISKTSGEFNDINGVFFVNEEDLTESSVEFTIQTASIDTDDEKRDGHLKSADFFEVEKYPAITFKSKTITKTENGHTLTGDLTIKDVTKEITFPFTFNGFITDPWGGKRFGAEAELTIDRQEYNVKWNKDLDNGGLLVGNEVDITIHIEAIKSTEGTN